jgi:catechol 2,3-dioxygenase-like lactoylglutathione lyase family enzyme
MAGKNKKINGGGFHHVFMKVSDLNKSLKFYTEGLGFVEKALKEWFCWILVTAITLSWGKL